jgi:hypothetical protein
MPIISTKNLNCSASDKLKKIITIEKAMIIRILIAIITGVLSSAVIIPIGG